MFIVKLKLKMACNGASLAAPGPIHNLNDSLLFNGIDWRALCAASYLINLRCDPRLSGATVGLMIKSLVQTIIRPEMAGHLFWKLKNVKLIFAPCSAAAAPLIAELCPLNSGFHMKKCYCFISFLSIHLFLSPVFVVGVRVARPQECVCLSGLLLLSCA